ncbi:hypothetical protein Pan54_21420 [Rubinisphaera italica]|uniref:Uncharacterized protein n=1 Tax=Rubinisphaera italica TaxID=2527969 RepID=A0A5C5XE67_9PLAN|nr:hypothetical protein Pan54_21420 [Rubinisphaera italica]
MNMLPSVIIPEHHVDNRRCEMNIMVSQVCHVVPDWDVNAIETLFQLEAGFPVSSWKIPPLLDNFQVFIGDAV